MVDGSSISPDLASAAGAAASVVGAVGGGAEAVLMGADAVKIATGNGHEASTAAGKVANGVLNGGSEPDHPLQANPSDRTAQADKPTITVRTTEFTSDMIGLPATDQRGGKREKGVRPSETITFNSEIINGFSGFSESYVQDLIRLYDQPSDYPDRFANRYEQMKAEQGTTNLRYLDDEYMLHFFAEKDPKSGLLNVKKPDEIVKLLQQRPEMMKHLMIIEDRYARDVLAALGARAELVGAGNRTDLGRIYDRVPLFGQGPSRRLTNRIADAWNSRNIGAGGRLEPGTRGQAITNAAVGITAAGASSAAIGGTAGILNGIGTGALIGVDIATAAGAGTAVGLSAAAAYGIAQRLHREGVVLDIREDQALRTASGATGELSRAKYFIGIDPDMPERSTNLDKARQRAIQIIYHRIDYMRTLGVPPQNLDALSDQRLYVDQQRPENNFSTSTRNINDRFERLGGFNPPGTTPEERLENQRNILRQAEEEELGRQFEKLIARETKDDPANDPAKIQERLDVQISARSKDGTLVTERNAKDTAERGRLTKDKEALDSDSAPLETYAKAARERIAAAEQAQRNLERELSFIIIPGTTSVDFDTAKATINEILSTPSGASITIPDENGRLLPTITSLLQQENTLEAQIQATITAAIAAMPARGPKETEQTFQERQNEVKRQARANFADRSIAITKQRDQLNDILTRLNGYQGIIENRNLPDPSQTTTIISSYENAYTEVTATLGTTPLSADFNTALSDINAAYIASSAAVAAGTAGAVIVGWPENENNDPNRRSALRKALAQQRRLAVLTPLVGTHLAHFDNITNNPNPNRRISPEELRSSSMDQLEAIADRLGIPGGTARTFRLRMARAYAIAQVESLQSAIKDEITSIQTTDAVLDRRIKSMDVTAEREQLELVKSIYGSTEPILSRALLATSIPDRREKLTNTKAVNPATAEREGYTQAEAASGLPRNILEIINILTNYQATADRNGEFTKIWKNLGGNPEMFVRFLNSSFRESLGGGNITSPNTMAKRLSTAIQSGALNTPRFNSGTEALIDQFVKWSSTI